MVRRLTFWIVLAFISHSPGTSAVALEQAELDASQAIWMEQGLSKNTLSAYHADLKLLSKFLIKSLYLVMENLGWPKR